MANGLATSKHRICRIDRTCYVCRDGRWWRVKNCDKKVQFIDGGEGVDVFLPSEGGTNLEPLPDDQEVRNACGPCEREQEPERGGGGRFPRWAANAVGAIAKVLSAIIPPLAAVVSIVGTLVAIVSAGVGLVLKQLDVQIFGIDFLDIFFIVVGTVLTFLFASVAGFATIAIITALLAAIKSFWEDVLRFFEEHPVLGFFIVVLFVIIAVVIVLVIVVAFPEIVALTAAATLTGLTGIQLLILALALVFLLLVLAVTIVDRLSR